MYPKIVFHQDFFGINALMQGFTQYARANNGAKPKKIILGREERRDLETVAHTGIDGAAFGENVKKGRFLMDKIDIPIELGERFELI